MLIDSDPHAEGFYLRLGGERIGGTAAPVPADAARLLPRLRFAVDGRCGQGAAPYSALSVVAGSTCVARQAGTAQATKPTAAKSAIAPR